MGCCDDLAGTAIAKCHMGGELDLVALCAMRDPGPLPTPLPPGVCVAVRVFQLRQEIENF